MKAYLHLNDRKKATEFGLFVIFSDYEIATMINITTITYLSMASPMGLRSVN